MKMLGALLRELGYMSPQDIPDVPISAVTADSRQAGADALFVAIPGGTSDGHCYIASAIQNGAVAVVGERARSELHSLPAGLPYVQVADSRLALAHLSASYWGYPSRKMTLVGVTGTDGKTTTANLIYAILTGAGISTGMISTVNARIGHAVYDTGLHTTTPDATDVQRHLADMVSAGTRIAILECTSHGLAQHRVSACDFDVAVVTNITHEHLDYHGTPKAYQQAKARLFWYLSESARKPGVRKVAVLNRDDSSFDYLSPIPADVHVTYGLSPVANVRAENIESTESATSFSAVTTAGSFDIRSHLVGAYNVHNLLAAVATAQSLGVACDQISAGVSSLSGVTGRTERIDEGQAFTVLVDFAHTPNALRQVLENVRKFTGGRITVVFGCAGLRDVQKRPMMGLVAAEWADLTILTAEDPRTEELRAINAQIIAGYQESGRPLQGNLLQIDDRGEAIQRAIDLAEPGDLVVIAGKGHEQSLCFGTEEKPWSDHTAARQALRARKRSGLSPRGSRVQGEIT